MSGPGSADLPIDSIYTMCIMLNVGRSFRALPSVHIIVKNGNVRLEGVVANQGDKDLINVRANGVPGVFSVTNDLQVEGK